MPRTWEKPCATTRPLYLSIDPSGFHLILKTQREPIAHLPGGNCTNSQVSFSRCASISASAAAAHLSASGRVNVSARVLGSMLPLVMNVHSMASTNGMSMLSSSAPELASNKALGCLARECHFSGNGVPSEGWCSKLSVRFLTAGGVRGRSIISGGVRGRSTSAGPSSHCTGEGGGGGGTTGGTRIRTTKWAGGLGASTGAKTSMAGSGRGAMGAGANPNSGGGAPAGMQGMGVVGGGDGSIDTSNPDSPGLWKG